MGSSANIANVLYQNIAAGRENKTAVFSADMTLTFGELVRLASRVGNALKNLDVERENRVALLLVDGPELVASFYGAMAIVGKIPKIANSHAKQIALNGPRQNSLCEPRFDHPRKDRDDIELHGSARCFRIAGGARGSSPASRPAVE